MLYFCHFYQIFEYKKLVQDNSQQVREGTHNAMSAIVMSIGYELLLTIDGRYNFEVFCSIMLENCQNNYILVVFKNGINKVHVFVAFECIVEMFNFV